MRNGSDEQMGVESSRMEILMCREREIEIEREREREMDGAEAAAQEVELTDGGKEEGTLKLVA